MLAKDCEVELTLGEKAAVDSHLLSLNLPLDIDLTYEDVYMKERYSKTRSRSDIPAVNFRTRLLPNLELGIPIISANMQSVTGFDMAVEMAKWGGGWILPQTLPLEGVFPPPLESRINLLEKIGRADCALIDRPLTIRPERTLAEARQVMKFNVTSLVVVNESGVAIGVLSHRDWCHEKKEDYNKLLVGSLMGGGRLRKLQTLRRGPIGPMFEGAAKILKENRIEKLPLVDQYGRLNGLITARGLFYKDYYPMAMRDNKGRFLRIGSIGVGKYYTKERAYEVEAQLKKGICALLIDSGRILAINPEEVVRGVHKDFPKLPLIVGNTSTPEGAKAIFEWGGYAAKINQGRGSVCRTSENGVGTPQLTAVAQASAIAKLYGKTIIADGGLHGPDDILMSIAAGAAAVMSGSLVVGTWESAAPSHRSKDGKLTIKTYSGEASFERQISRIQSGTLDKVRRPEGVSEEVPVIGSLKRVLAELLDGMRSGMCMFGATDIASIRERVIFRRRTKHGRYEGIKRK